MSDHRSRRSKIRCLFRRDGKDKGGAKQPDILAIHGSRAGRSSVDNQLSTAPEGNNETVSASPAQPIPEPVSQVQVSQEPPDKQAHEQSSQRKPYAENYDMWKEALNSLGEEERYNVNTLLKDWDHDSPKRKHLVEEIQKRMDEALNSKHHDRTTSIGKLLSVLNNFLSAGDVAVSFDPTHAALPWAAVRCVIVMVTAHNELKGVILTAMAEVTSLLVRCDMYQLLYMAPDPALRLLDDFLTRLRACIVQTYAAVQSFFAFVNDQQRSLKIVDVFKLEDARAHMDKLSGTQKQLLQAADDCEKSSNRSNRSDLKELLDLSSEIPIIRQQVDLVLERIDAREERELLEWISPIPYGTHHRVRVESRTPDTCEWLLQNKEFCEWMDYGSSAILWLRGSMGAGKTYLTSKVIDHVQGLLESSSDHAGFAFFYCNRNEENRRDPLCILQSYVRQLSTAVGNTQHIRKRLKSVTDRTRRQGSHLGFEDCKIQLADSVNEYSETVIVLDALDECNQDSRWQLIHVIKDLVSNSDRPLKVFISSRPYDDDIKTQISGRNIEIEAIDNQGDIEKFVNAEMEKPRRWGPIPADLRSKIVQVLCEDSQGMFQWAYLQIKQVLALSTRADIEIKLGKLPKTLEEAYREIYGEIAKSPRRKALVDSACKWVMSAFTPLSSDQLLSAIHIDVDGHPVSSDDQLNDLDNRRRRSPESSFFGMASKQDISPEDVTIFVMCRFSLYILLQDWWDNAEIMVSQTNDCGDTTLQLAAQAGCKPICEALMKRVTATHSVLPGDFYGRALAAAAGRGYQEIVKILVQNGADVNIPLPSGCYGSALAAAAAYGKNMEIFKILIEKGADVSLPLSSGDYGSALAAAGYGGNMEIVMIIINNGADVNLLLSSGRYGSALAAAASSGNSEIIKTLIENGADVNLLLSSGDYGSALAAAAFNRNLEIVKILIENRADVNLLLSSGKYGSALAAAAASDASFSFTKDPETVNILIANGADVNLKLLVGEYGSALAAAAANFAVFAGHTKVLEVLIANGADVNLKLLVGNYGSALAAAAFHAAFAGHIESFTGQTKFVEFLIENGADVNLLLSSGMYGSALATVAFVGVLRGETKTLKILIENGADVNLLLSSGDFGSALAAAAAASAMSTKDSEIIKILIENGADVNLKLLVGAYGGSALAAAASIATPFTRGTETIKILIENGADVNLTLSSGDKGSALVAAIDEGFPEIVKFLIENGADVNLTLPDGNYRSALAAANSRGYEDIENILVDNGATTNLVLFN
ncbi:hypothetical protein N7517_007638 [Penicillium concentricum]|uniref:Nephrocystin 3-like N-terminal domain-containing protein n=1 Tax=Penicillium concentricum TaxID=293559 RepID=A0A9W9SCJ1_9EURO|nr:uncharacterized protein N7517_007638 [Penicillium concentricum]KAJ5375632.1 hypothetical protein N7517_007638 [Penicillium concentricum]